jgi:hypothetical protein
MAFSFPYPVLGTVKRPVGQGCKVCVHRTYCPAVYWQRRYGLGVNLEDSWTGPDDHNGIQCSSWSDDPAARIKGHPTQTDLDEAAYIWAQGIGSEADRNGITFPATGTSRLP